MKYLPLQLLLVALILVCESHCRGCSQIERMTSVPDYKSITSEPKKVISVEYPHGLCVADNGNFAVVSYATTGVFHMYHGCGKLMKTISLPDGSWKQVHCAFFGNYLYVVDHNRNIYKFSVNGTYIKNIAGQPFNSVAACDDHLYATAGADLVTYKNDKEVSRFKLKIGPRKAIFDLDKNVRTSRYNNEIEYYSLEGKLLDTKKYNDLVRVDGIALDSAGNMLLADRRPQDPRVQVISPCGKLIKTIESEQFVSTVDVEVGNDGTIIVADVDAHKVFLY